VLLPLIGFRGANGIDLANGFPSRYQRIPIHAHTRNMAVRGEREGEVCHTGIHKGKEKKENPLVFAREKEGNLFRANEERWEGAGEVCMTGNMDAIVVGETKSHSLPNQPLV
jgi:hypothetical protein